MMRKLTLAVLAASACAAAVPASAQSAAAQQRFDAAQQRFDREYQIFRNELEVYRGTAGRNGGGNYRDAPDYRAQGYDSYEDWRDEGGYDPAQYYRSGNQYRERVLGPDDRVYSGNDGRYYCRRSDGTVGTLLGGALGALGGRAVDRNQSQIRCR